MLFLISKYGIIPEMIKHETLCINGCQTSGIWESCGEHPELDTWGMCWSLGPPVLSGTPRGATQGAGSHTDKHCCGETFSVIRIPLISAVFLFFFFNWSGLIYKINMLRYGHCRTEWLGPSGQADFVTQGARPRPPSSSSSALKPEKLKGWQARLHRLM